MFTKLEGTKLICVTPVKNEEWFMDRFIQCASLWADHIIIADQSSTDNTWDICSKYDKVTLVKNEMKDFSEVGMRTLLTEEARKIPAEKRIIMHIDADEIISANFDSNEWQTLLELPVGSVIRIPIANLNPDMETHSGGIHVNLGFVDDGKALPKGGVLHSVRIPWVEYDITIMETREIRLLHYYNVSPERLASKRRRYMAYERIARDRFGIDTIRQYSFLKTQAFTQIPVPENWMEGYQAKGIDMTSVSKAYSYWHDQQVLGYLEEHGTKYFAMCDIWDDFDWVEYATGRVENPERFSDPRSKVQKLVFKYARRTIHASNSGRFKGYLLRFTDGLIRMFGYSS